MLCVDYSIKLMNNTFVMKWIYSNEKSQKKWRAYKENKSLQETFLYFLTTAFISIIFCNDFWNFIFQIRNMEYFWFKAPKYSTFIVRKLSLLLFYENEANNLYHRVHKRAEGKFTFRQTYACFYSYEYWNICKLIFRADFSILM